VAVPLSGTALDFPYFLGHSTGLHSGRLAGHLWSLSATNEVGSSYIVVDTGPWIFGKKVLLPAGTIDRVDTDGGNVYVDLTKDQIKDSPEFDQSSYNEPAYRNRVGDYYGRYYTR
jgi:hypothetical protein